MAESKGHSQNKHCKYGPEKSLGSEFWAKHWLEKGFQL